jgi:hypothetical protein
VGFGLFDALRKLGIACVSREDGWAKLQAHVARLVNSGQVKTQSEAAGRLGLPLSRLRRMLAAEGLDLNKPGRASLGRS